MILIGLTMLRHLNTRHGDWHDALDQRWSVFLNQCGLTPLYLPNDPDISTALVKQLRPHGLLLTGGGDCSAVTGAMDNRDATEQALLDLAGELLLPVLGVCRGMQVMLTRAGGTLESVSDHVGKHMIVEAEERRQVNSFHDYGFRHVPNGYDVLAVSDDGVVEAVYHPQLRHTGIMWHPERSPAANALDIQRVLQSFGVAP
nr:gamma-glutamyl-gamma-aminobutyrate hydrolase family protein [uncultured Pseudomonas sp.]